jgi:hypothetical protein
MLVREARMLFRTAAGGREPCDYVVRVFESMAGGTGSGAGSRERIGLGDALAAVQATTDYVAAELHATRPEHTRNFGASRQREAGATFTMTIPARGSHAPAAAAGGAAAAGPGASAKEAFLLHGPLPVSSYARDLGDYGQDPRGRPLQDATGSGLYQTTRELAEGTTRVAKHVPGFTGHIPRAKIGAAVEQGLGATQRDTFNSKTNLAVTYTRRVPG